MPEKVSNVQSSNYRKHLQAPFVIYSDFESNLKEVQKPDGDNANPSYTDRYQKHFVCSYGHQVVCIEDRFNKQVKHIEIKMQFTSLLKKMLKETEYCKEIRHYIVF